MKENEKNTMIDAQEEIQNIKNYIVKYWNISEELVDNNLFENIWAMALEKTSGIFESYVFSNLVNKRMLKVEEKEKSFLIDLLLTGVDVQTKNYANWDYEKVVTDIMRKIKKQYSTVNDIKPIGWDEFAKNYKDYKGMETLDFQKLKKEFGGYKFNTGGALSFEVRTSLPHVMYDDKNQGRNPLEVLIGAMVTHAYSISNNNNIAKILDEWDSFLKDINNESFLFKEKLSVKMVNMLIEKNSDYLFLKKNIKAPLKSKI